MAAGLDKLLDFLLAEVALCGTQGAGSADFVRFIEKYYEEIDSSTTGVGILPKLSGDGLSRAFFERVWSWVSHHPDIRVTYNGQVHQFSLAEFEAAEKSTAGQVEVVTRNGDANAIQPHIPTLRPAESLAALREKLRVQLSLEGDQIMSFSGTVDQSAPQPTHPQSNGSREEPGRDSPAKHMRHCFQMLQNSHQAEDTIFDDSSFTTTAPRLHASQNRVWQALTGHEIDIKKVPSMEFMLLSIIAAHGAAGITQPELTQLSNQDKRSVPKRTDELARKGYIIKKPVQAGKIRTSVCVHSKFVSQDHFLTTATVNDVFQVGTFVVTGFAHLLYNKLKDAGVVPTRDIRRRLDVPIRTWNKRAVQGALIRLDQSGMIKRFRVRKKRSEDAWVLCIKVLREPRSDDLDNLGFRRQVPLEDPAEELLHDDVEGDTLMRDLEIDMLDDNDEEEEHTIPDEDLRIPPQWTPDRLLSNTLFDASLLGRDAGIDGITIRDRIIGPFWRRPLESYLTRVTDDWERTQPPHLRHLAIIRDTRTTDEKRFVHYVYRTYACFKQAVAAGEVAWEGVRKLNTDKKQNAFKTAKEPAINAWGFCGLNKKDFLQADGAASVSDVQSAIMNRRHGPRWDMALAQEIGHQKAESPVLKGAARGGRPSTAQQTPSRLGHKNVDEQFYAETGNSRRVGANSRSKATKGSTLDLTTEQRIALGLKPTGRLSKSAEKQIIQHRRETGDPASLPETIVEEPVVRKQAPLMTKEERIAAGLPGKGRLGLNIENKLREERGMPKLIEKGKRKSTNNGPAILTKEQRIQLGLKPHGRLHQDFIEALRRERDNDIPLEESPAVKTYLATLKAKEANTTKSPSVDLDVVPSAENPQLPQNPSDEAGHADLTTGSFQSNVDHMVSMILDSHKRKGSDGRTSPPISKRARHEASPIVEETAPTLAPLPALQTDLFSDLVASVEAGSTGSVLEVPSVENNEEQNSVAQLDPISKLTQKTRKKPKQIHEVQLEEVEAPRISSGLYIFSSAKRKVTRGRPRNAFVAVFKFPRLQDFDWFVSEASDAIRQAQPAFNSKSPESSHGLSNGLGKDVSSDHVAVGDATSPPAQLAGAAVAEEIAQPGEDSDLTINMPNDENTQDHAVVQGVEPSPETSEGDAPNNINEERPPLLEQIPVQGTIPPAADSAIPENQAFDMPVAQPALRAVAGLSSLNMRTAASRSPYHSPYAQSVRSESIPLSQTNDVAGVGAGDEDRTNNSMPTTEVSAALPPGLVAGPEEVTGNATYKFKPKGPGSGISGSQARFRQAIIQEIIDRCGGVFPLHGEIWRPFSALWDERHGHTSIKKPINSTVFETLREMIDKPAFGLKRFSFYAKARNAAGAKQKMMVVRKEIAHTDPRVLELAQNMANNSLDKSHQFFPGPIRDLIDFETFYTPVKVAPKDETVALDQLYPELLEKNIQENKIKRKKEKVALKKSEKEAAKLQNERVEEVMSKRHEHNPTVPREKRARLASLNDKNKRYRRAVTQAPPVDLESEGVPEEHMRCPSPTGTDSSEDIPLMSLRHAIADPMDQIMQEQISDIAGEAEDDEIEGTHEQQSESQIGVAMTDAVSFTHPIVAFVPTTGTYSTSFCITRRDTDSKLSNARTRSRQVRKASSKKRVRISEPGSGRPAKKPRSNGPRRKQLLDTEFVQSSSDDSDATSSEEELEEWQTTSKQKKQRKTLGKRQLGKNMPLPTLLQRLTGLTGNPNDPIYKDPKLRRQREVRPWSQRKKFQLRKERKERQYQESLNPVDNFKKLCCTLALAQSMSGEAGVVSWGIVEKVYARDKFFNLSKTQKLWKWLQVNLAAEFVELTANFQTLFLEAYEDCRIPEIEDPETYDWAGVVRWIMRTCTYPEVSLPLYREAIKKFVVDESNHAALDRTNWYGKRAADTTRTQLQLQYSFVSPLHRQRSSLWSPDDKVLKARAWTRANVATPQAIYNANTAHEKLKILGEDILVQVVGDLVQHEHLRLRKIKRQLPGRNYTFTKKFASNYRRPFELSDFMEAAHLKKSLDVAFSNDDVDKRFLSISQSEEDGSIMAIMSLVSAGKVKLVPQLPAVDNEFGAPLPRLSKWGFCEGDYIHRAIDRNRLFWDVHVVPTPEYEFGNPLQPQTAQSLRTSDGIPMNWLTLPEPPLPGKTDANALLPIWSSIGGNAVTWPWWYRILNLVLQPLFLQPGATATDIHAHCPEHTTEIFEVQLVLDWLASVGAVTKTAGEGYQVTAYFWAAFGDKLFETEDDWFGEQVKRKTKMTTKQRWRDQYNLRYSTLLARSEQANGPSNGVIGHGGDIADNNEPALEQRIMDNSKAQYGIVLESLIQPESTASAGGQVEDQSIQQTLTAEPNHNSTADSVSDESMGNGTQISVTAAAPDNTEDVVMADVDENGDEDAPGDDLDAIGEIDDEMN